MDAEQCSRQLRGVQEKYKDRVTLTFEVCISDMARDAADAIDGLLAKNKQLEAGILIGVDLSKGTDFSPSVKDMGCDADRLEMEDYD